MLLTLYYMAATWLQSWRLGAMRAKILLMLGRNESLVLSREPPTARVDVDGLSSLPLSSVSSAWCVNQEEARVGDLVWFGLDTRGCSLYPTQRVDVTRWISFQGNQAVFPIEVSGTSQVSLQPDLALHLLLEADYSSTPGGNADNCCRVRLEDYGIPRAWRADAVMGVIMQTDVDRLAKLATAFMHSRLEMDDGMQLLRLETVAMQGQPCVLLNVDCIPVVRRSVAAMTPDRWHTHVALLASLTEAAEKAVEEGEEVAVAGHDWAVVAAGEHQMVLAAPEKTTTTNYPDTAPLSPESTASLPAGSSSLAAGSSSLETGSASYSESSSSLLTGSACLPTGSASLPTGSTSSATGSASLPSVSASLPTGSGSIPQDSSSLPTGSACLPRDSASLPPVPASLPAVPTSLPAGPATLPPGPATLPAVPASLPPGPATLSAVPASLPAGPASLPPGSATLPAVPASLPTVPASLPAVPGPDESPDSMHTLPSTVEASPVRQLKDEDRAGSSADSFCSLDSASTASVASKPPYVASRPLDLPPVKPPNVLVYSESPAALENVKSVLQTVLHPHKYTVYGLGQDQLLCSPWAANTRLLVVWGSVSDRLAPAMVHYLLTGGQLLCLCSDLLLRVLPSFQTAEVREKELVRFSYSRWKSVPLMHDVFCYQASPSHARFTDDKSLAVPSSVEMTDCTGVSRTLEVKVLGCEETWHTPSLLLATVRGGEGRAVFSQIHLEQEPSQYEVSDSKWGSLKDSEVARLDILRDLLVTQLGLECADKTGPAQFTQAYFLGLFELKQEFLSRLQDRLQTGGVVKLAKLSLQLCGKGVQPAKATASLMPLLLHACPEHFSTVEYFENLGSKCVGRLVVYAEVMTSSMQVLDGPPLHHGLAVVPVQQTQGVGRSGNKWLSPPGCAMFSLQLHVPCSSYLGQHIPLLQHISALAVVKGVRDMPGYERLDLRLKWPNDIYVGSAVKIGGLVVTSTTINQLCICNIGCGVNLSNSYPTSCINSAIELYNSTSHEKPLAPLSLERFLAAAFTEVERLIEQVQRGEVDKVLRLYYMYWLHSEASVTVAGRRGSDQLVTILGLDDYGFLLVRGTSGAAFSVQPDGNSFDMLRGLIGPSGN